MNRLIAISIKHIQRSTDGILKRLASCPVEELPFTVGCVGTGFAIVVDPAGYEALALNLDSVLKPGAVVTRTGDTLPDDFAAILNAMRKWRTFLAYISPVADIVPELKLYPRVGGNAPAEEEGVTFIIPDWRVRHRADDDYREVCRVDDLSAGDIRATVRHRDALEIDTVLPGGESVSLFLESDRGCLKVFGYLPRPPEGGETGFTHDEPLFRIGVSPNSTFIAINEIGRTYTCVSIPHDQDGENAIARDSVESQRMEDRVHEEGLAGLQHAVTARGGKVR